MTVAKNYIYNLIYQVTILLLPLVTVPYIARVLRPYGVGVYGFTNSIIQYFILFGTIGIALYGNRAIAYVRDDKEQLSHTFWEIVFLKAGTVLLAYIAFMIFLSVTHGYHTIYLVQSIFLISAAVDISWLFMGLEDFKKTVMRNLIVRLLGVSCIFLFVKESDDLWKYALVLASSELLGQASLWAYVPRTVNRIRVTWKDITKHLMPSIGLFIPQVAIQIYLVLNKTMLGSLASKSEVGFFDNSDKIVKMVLAIATAMGVVMLPRMANTFARGEMYKVRQYLYQSFSFASYLAFPMAFGLAGIAGNFAPWFFGPGYEKTGTIICVIAPIIVFIAWSNVIGQQYLMPTGQTRGYTLSVCVGAIVNFILNLVLIKHYLSIGTAISTVVAELSVTVVQILYVYKTINIRQLFTSTWKYMISGIVMYLVILALNTTPLSGIILVGVQVICGVMIYFMLLFILRSEMNKELFNRGLQMIKKKSSAK